MRLHLPAAKTLQGVLIATAGLMICAPSVSLAKRVVIMDFTGPNARTVYSAISRAIRGNHTVVPRKTLQAEAKKLGIGTKCDPSIIPGVASMMGAESVVCGKLTGRRSRSKLTVQVYNGGDGNVLKTVRIKLDQRGLNTKAIAYILKKLDPSIAKSWNWAADDGETKKKAAAAPANKFPFEEDDTEPGEEEETSPRANATATLPEKKAWENEDGENPLNRPAAARPSSSVVAAPTAPRRVDGEHAVRLSVGPSFLLRRSYLVSNAASPLDGQSWKTSPVAGLALNAELYPASWFTKGWASMIGLGVNYERYFGLGWKVTGEQEEHQATHQVFGVNLRGRYGLDLGFRKLLIKAQVGYRYLGFAMNDTPQSPALIPDVAFSSLDMGAGVEMDILPRWLRATAHFNYMPTFSKGEVTSQSEYGSAKGSGMRFGGSLGGALFGSFGWKVAMEYNRYAINFKGDPAARRKAQQARDNYINGALFFTYMN